MNARVLLIVGLFATAAVTFSGTAAEHTGIEVTESAVALCTEAPEVITGQPATGCLENYVCQPAHHLIGANCIA